MEIEDIKEKLSYIKELIKKINERLEKYPLEKDNFSKENIYVSISKYCEEIVEVATKINNIFLEEKKEYASSYYETFTKLSKNYNINEDFLEKIAKTTGFRNRLVHEYVNLDEEITMKSFKNLVQLYEKYIIEISKILSSAL